MKTSNLDVWIKRILATEDEEISCSECFDLLPEVVEVEVLHGEYLAHHLKVKQHLIQCQVCHDEHEILLNLARMDAEGEDSLLEE